MNESIGIKKSRKHSKCSICDSDKNVKILSIETKNGTISLRLCEDCREEITLTLEDEALGEFEQSSAKRELDLMGL